MESYAVVETGGKQYRVSTGQTIEVERLDAEIGAEIEAPKVLASSDGSTLRLSTDDTPAPKVICTVVNHKRGPKLISFKKKRRKGYERKLGHRQELTVLNIKSIG